MHSLYTGANALALFLITKNSIQSKSLWLSRGKVEKKFVKLKRVVSVPLNITAAQPPTNVDYLNIMIWYNLI